jgi:hypothetical protein
MKKIVLGAIIIGFTLSIVFLISGIIEKIHLQTQIKEKTTKLPLFSCMKLNNDIFNSLEIESGPVLIVQFHPECDHCRYEISEILKSDIPDFTTKVILISNAHPDSIKRFLSQFNYDDFPSVIPLVDNSNSFGEIFGNYSIPSNYIYNKDLNLITVLKGEVKTETILKYLHK